MIYTKPPVRQVQEEPNFKTELSPIKEAQFKVWYRNMANTLELAPDPDDPLHYYDYRGYWEENPTQILERGDHFGDKFKTPGHPTFSDQSMYSAQQDGSNIAGGKWDGKYFVHSKDTDQHADRTDEYLEGTGEMPVYEGGDLDEIEVSPQEAPQEYNYGGQIARYQQSANVNMPDPPLEIEDNIKIDPSDKIFQNLQELIVDPTRDEQRRRIGKWGGIHNFYGDEIADNSTGCLSGALNCNQYTSRWIDANSIRDGMNKKLGNVVDKYDLKNDQGKYSGGLDAWEVNRAFMEEGLGKELWNRDTDTEGELHALIKSGDFPLGAFFMQGTDGYISPEYGENTDEIRENLGYNPATHVSISQGWTPDGQPFFYDFGNASLANESMYVGSYGDETPNYANINQVFVPNEYAKYTYNNVMAQHTGNMKDFQRKGAESFVPNENAPSYINNINKGLHIAGPVIKKEFGLSDSIVKKLNNVVTGLAAQETNFNNQGDELGLWKKDAVTWKEGDVEWKEGDILPDVTLPEVDVNFKAIKENIGSWFRQAAITGESSITNDFLKPIVKRIQNLAENKQGVPDWMVEIEAYDNVEGDENKFREEYNKLREKYRVAEVDSEADNPSVGPLAIKNLSNFSKYNLGLSKDEMYGPSVDDADEFSRGSQAALVHLAEDFTALKKHYDGIYKKDDRLTNNQLIDLATVAYNNKGKAYSPDFVDFYIKGKKMSDNYLSKIQALSRKYTPQEPQASLQLPERNERGGNIRGYQDSGNIGLEPGDLGKSIFNKPITSEQRKWVSEANRSAPDGQTRYVGDDTYEQQYSLPPFEVEADRKARDNSYRNLGNTVATGFGAIPSTILNYPAHLTGALYGKARGKDVDFRSPYMQPMTKDAQGNTVIPDHRRASTYMDADSHWGAKLAMDIGTDPWSYLFTGVGGAKTIGQGAKNLAKTLPGLDIGYGATQLGKGLASNAWRLNPNALGRGANKFQTGDNFRFLNNAGIDDILSTGKIRSGTGGPHTNWTTGAPNTKYAKGDNTNLVRINENPNQPQMLPAEGGELGEGVIKGDFFGEAAKYPVGTDVLPRQSFKINTTQGKAGKLTNTFDPNTKTGFPLQYDEGTMQMLKPHWWKRYQQMHQGKTIPKDLNKLGEIDAARHSFMNKGNYMDISKGDDVKFNEWYGGNLDDQGLLTMNRYVQGYEGIDKLLGGQSLLNPRGLAPGVGHSSGGGYQLTEPQLIELLNHYAGRATKFGKPYRDTYGSHSQANSSWLRDVLDKWRKGENILDDIVDLQSITGQGSHAPQLLNVKKGTHTFADPLMSWTGDMSSAENWLNRNKWIASNDQPLYQLQSKFDPNSIFRAGRMTGRDFKKGKFDIGEAEWTTVGNLDKHIVPELKGVEGFTAKKVAKPNWRYDGPVEGGGLDPFQETFRFMDNPENLFPTTSFNKLTKAKAELKSLGKGTQSTFSKNKKARLEKSIAELNKEISGIKEKAGRSHISNSIFKQLLQSDPNSIGLPALFNK